MTLLALIGSRSGPQQRRQYLFGHAFSLYHRHYHHHQQQTLVSRQPVQQQQQQLAFSSSSSSLALETPTTRLPYVMTWTGSGQVPRTTRTATTTTTRLWSSTVENVESQQQQQSDITKMRAIEIKKELESYGIDTKKFLEKSELVQALQQARDEGKTPLDQKKDDDLSSSSSSSASSQSTTTLDSSSTDQSKPREERLQEELVNCQTMKALELKQELKERGVSTTALFEKSELVQALANARVDGIMTKNKEQDDDNDDDVVKKVTDVEVLTDETSGPQKRQSQQQQQQPQQGVSKNPFPGGIPGMGGFGNMFGNVAGAAGAGANPFAGMGAGANPFGASGNPFDTSGADGGNNNNMQGMAQKAQEIMKNPKVRELMQKAQSNPRIALIMQQVMQNPAMAMNKYKDDPDLRELIQELQKYVQL